MESTLRKRSSGSESNSNNDSEDDFDIPKPKKAKSQGNKSSKKPKRSEPFSPKVLSEKNKNKVNKYRMGKQTQQKKIYELSQHNGISASLIVPKALFSKEVEVSGSGFTLDEITVAHSSNFVPYSKAKEQLSLREHRHITFLGDVPTDEEIDDFLHDAVLRTLGKEVKTSVPNEEGDQVSDEETPEQESLIDSKIIQDWLDTLPSSLSKLHWATEFMKDPLYRFVEEQFYEAGKLLQTVREDLQNSLIWIEDGEVEDTASDTISSLVKGGIPSGWLQYPVPKGLSTDEWISDFIYRINKFQETSEIVGDSGPASLRSVELSLGCLMNPKQFLEATKETVSKMNYTPKEDLELHLKPSDKSSNDVGFDVNSLVMQGASFRSGRLVAASGNTELGTVTLLWKKKKETKDVLPIPIYLGSDKKIKLMEAFVPVSTTKKMNKTQEKKIVIVALPSYDKM